MTDQDHPSGGSNDPRTGAAAAEAARLAHLAGLRWLVHGDGAGTEALYRRALGVAPTDVPALLAYGQFFEHSAGEPGRAEAMYERAMAVPGSGAWS